MKYRFVADEEVLEFFVTLSAAKRDSLLSILQSLPDSAPIRLPDDYRDSTGRGIHRQDFTGWTVWFWYDSPVHEVRVVDVEIRRR